MFLGEGIFTRPKEDVVVTIEFHPKKPRIRKFVLHWRGRRYEITRVNLYWRDTEGEVLMHYFQLTACGKNFTLRFDTKKLKWFVEEIYEAH